MKIAISQKFLLMLAFVLCACSAAYAIPSAPEIDPGSAVGALALLGGTIAVLRARRG